MSKEFPVWDEKYEKLGVTPHELYMRQNGLCWLKPRVLPDGDIKIYCTDGKDEAETALMLNPTYECARCMMRFTTDAIKEKLSGNESQFGEDSGGSNTR